MIQSSDGEESCRSSARHWNSTIDLRKHDLAAEITLAIDRLRLIVAEAAAAVGLEPSELRGIVDDGAVAGISVERLKEVVEALACWELRAQRQPPALALTKLGSCEFARPPRSMPCRNSADVVDEVG